MNKSATISSRQDFELIAPNETEIEILDRLGNSFKNISEMSDRDRKFLNTLILRNKPMKVLEIGVSQGGSSILMLNAIKEIGNSHLYSIDYNEIWYGTQGNQKTGDFVNNYPELKTNWTLFTGDLSLHFMVKIGHGIDFCLIDTAHFNPGEILDFLMVLPFLSDDAIVVLHDTKLHAICYEKNQRFFESAITNNLLMSSIYGKKLISTALSLEDHSFPNIGAVRLNADTRHHLFEIFNLLTMKWAYLPSENEESDIIDFFGRYYDRIFVKYLQDVFFHHRKCFNINRLELQNKSKTVKSWMKRIAKNFSGK